MLPAINIIWFRRDLRLSDNAALYHALKAGQPVLPIFIFDTHILSQLEDKQDPRVAFIHAALGQMQQQLEAIGSTLEVHIGSPIQVFENLISKYAIGTVFTNHDYELYANQRDAQVADLLATHHIAFKTFKDQVIFEKEEVVKDDGKPFTVITPYSRKWKARLRNFYLKSYPTQKYFQHFYKQPPIFIPSLLQIGFAEMEVAFPNKTLAIELVEKYEEQRDIPSIRGTSHLGVHLRFGTISIRQLASTAAAHSQTFFNELIWRDFYQCILYHFLLLMLLHNPRLLL